MLEIWFFLNFLILILYSKGKNDQSRFIALQTKGYNIWMGGKGPIAWKSSPGEGEALLIILCFPRFPSMHEAS